MNKLKISLIACAMFALSGFSQSTKIENVLNLRSAKSSGVIKEDAKLAGYYVFYTKEKVDKKNTAYEVETFDNNYRPAKKFEIVRSKKTILIEMVYNGEVFMFHFWDKKTGYEFTTYDRAGKKLGSYVMGPKEISKYDLSRVSMSLQNKSNVTDIYPMGKDGFVRSTFTKNKKQGYELLALDNNCKVRWTVGSDPASKQLEFLEISDVSENMIAGTLTKKKSAMTKELDQWALLVNPKTGKVIREIELGTEKEGVRSLMKAFINEKTENLTIVGEFYKPKDDIVKDRSQGLYIQEFDLSGKELNMTKYKWKGDIDKFKIKALNNGDSKGANRPYYMYFHDVVFTADGGMYVVAEQFIKQVSAGGVAMNALAMASGGSTDASAFEILIANMIVIQIDSKKKLVDFDVIEKKKTRVILPAGYGLVNTTTLGLVMNSYGYFDYSYTSVDEEKDAYDIVYIDANRREEKGDKNSDVMIGVISIRNGKMENKRVALNTDAKFYWISQAKPGFIAIQEYYKKEKYLEFRLEPLSY